MAPQNHEPREEVAAPGWPITNIADRLAEIQRLYNHEQFKLAEEASMQLRRVITEARHQQEYVERETYGSLLDHAFDHAARR